MYIYNFEMKIVLNGKTKLWQQPPLQHRLKLVEGCRPGCGHHTHCQHALIMDKYIQNTLLVSSSET